MLSQLSLCSLSSAIKAANFLTHNSSSTSHDYLYSKGNPNSEVLLVIVAIGIASIQSSSAHTICSHIAEGERAAQVSWPLLPLISSMVIVFCLAPIGCAAQIKWFLLCVSIGSLAILKLDSDQVIVGSKLSTTDYLPFQKLLNLMAIISGCFTWLVKSIHMSNFLFWSILPCMWNGCGSKLKLPC